MFEKFLKFFKDKARFSDDATPLIEGLYLFEALPKIENAMSVNFETSAFSFGVRKDSKKITEARYVIKGVERTGDNYEELVKGFYRDVANLFKQHRDVVSFTPNNLREVFHLSSIIDLYPEITVRFYSDKGDLTQDITLRSSGLFVTCYVIGLFSEWKEAFVKFEALRSIAGIPSRGTRELWSWEIEKITIKEFLRWAFSFAGEITVSWRGNTDYVAIYPYCNSEMTDCKILSSLEKGDDVIDRLKAILKLKTINLSELLNKEGIRFGLSMPFAVLGEISSKEVSLTF